jgi:hypothetical protein
MKNIWYDIANLVDNWIIIQGDIELAKCWFVSVAQSTDKRCDWHMDFT